MCRRNELPKWLISWRAAMGGKPPPERNLRPLRPARLGAPSPSVAAKSPAQAPRVSLAKPQGAGAAIAGSDWSRDEVETVVEDDFEMLEQELKVARVNKADHNRRLQALLPGRSHGSVEFKHQNISAVLLELGYPSVSGYKPRGNYQELLRTAVTERMATADQAQAPHRSGGRSFS